MSLDVIDQDAVDIANDERLPWSHFDGRTILVTGATGLIGKSLLCSLIQREQLTASGTRIICLVRDVDRARQLFGSSSALTFCHWTAEQAHELPPEALDADIVLHCANMTSSADFIERPIEIIDTTIAGARSMLELGASTGARVCLLSSMEIYGEVESGKLIDEESYGSVDSMSVRSSYPEAKRLSEVLCAAFVSERSVDARVVRLSQTFGPGVARGDGRVFAEFARRAVDGDDIVLLTDGSKRNSYLYTADAVRAILFATALGEAGVAYNAANDETYCSIREMAEMVMSSFGKSGAAVRVEIDPVAAKRFRKGNDLRLDTSRLRALGWQPQTGLKEMYARMIKSWE